MERKMIFKIIFLICLASCHGQRFSLGPCPKVTPMENFQPILFFGKWNVLEQYPSLFEGNSKCNQQKFAILSNRIAILFTFKRDNFPMFYVADGTTKDKGNIPNWSLSINTINFNMDYTIIDTDYKNYAVAYSCNNVASGLSHIENAWILTRKNPEKVFAESTAIGRQKLSAFNIATNPLTKIEHDC